MSKHATPPPSRGLHSRNFADLYGIHDAAGLPLLIAAAACRWMRHVRVHMPGLGFAGYIGMLAHVVQRETRRNGVFFLFRRDWLGQPNPIVPGLLAFRFGDGACG
jgi:hypothetical protein